MNASHRPAGPSWDLHRTFLAVVREGSLSAAARRLGLTQPTVARHIEALEQAVGTDLFLRSPRGLMPTETALELRPYAETLAATAAALMRTASGRPGAVRGCVRISASQVVGVEHLPPILARLRDQHRGLVVELVLSNALDDLLRRDADIAVRMVAPTQQALLARKLPPVALGLHASSTYLARRGVPDSMAALRDHDLIGFDSETPALRAFAERFPEVARADFALRTDSDLAQLAAIHAGFGIGVCQTAVARDLVRVLEDAFAPALGLWIVMHEDLAASPRCRVVFDALADGLAVL